MDRESWVWRLVNLNPALWRMAVTAVFTLASYVGLSFVPGLPDAVLGVVLVTALVVQAVWTRAGVTPNAKVAVAVPDPVGAPDIVEPGEATTTASSGDIVDAARMARP